MRENGVVGEKRVGSVESEMMMKEGGEKGSYIGRRMAMGWSVGVVCMRMDSFEFGDPILIEGGSVGFAVRC